MYLGKFVNSSPRKYPTKPLGNQHSKCNSQKYSKRKNLRCRGKQNTSPKNKYHKNMKNK